MKRSIVAVFVILAVMIAGCSNKTDSEKALSEEKVKADAKKTEPVVKIGDGIISVDDLTNYIKTKPIQQPGKSSKEVIEKYLDDMISEEVIYQEAIRQKIDQDPQLKNTIRRMINQKLMADQVNSKMSKFDGDQTLLQQYYEKYRDEFNRPDQARLADIFIAIPPDANNEKKAELKKKAEMILAEAKQGIQNQHGITSLIHKYSDAPAKYPKGDTGFFDIEGNPAGIDKNMAEAAFKLEKTGDISEHIIETPDGFHIILLTAKRPAISRSLEEVANLLKQRIKQEEFPKMRSEYIDGLKKNVKIQIDQQKVDEVMKSMEGLKGNKPPMPHDPRMLPQGRMGHPTPPPERPEK